MRLIPLALLVLPLVLPTGIEAQQPPPVKPPADTLTRAERDALREIARDARAQARVNTASDSVSRRKRAEAAAPTAFGSPEAKAILERARVARVSQDSALTAYRATTTQRISVGMGVRRVGLEKLLFRMDNVAQVAWKRGVGVRVIPQGSRMTVPMASTVQGNAVEAVSIPYFPGRESLWFPSSTGVVKSDINEREAIHPLANGAETYYRYETGDSVDLRLPDNRVVRLRELRITARKPEWRTFVGSFWFDRDGGQLVRAAYRLAANIEIWDVVSEEVKLERVENAEAARLRDSLARERLPRDVYVKDSIQRVPRPEAQRGGNGDDDDVPALVKAMMRPANAKLDAITVEYGLYEGKFWLPRANSATASMQMGFVRVPVTIDEKFSYDVVNGDFSLAAVPPAPVRRSRTADSLAGLNADSIAKAELERRRTAGTDGGDVTVTVGGTARRDTAAIRLRRDSIARANPNSREAQCARDSMYVRYETRYEGALRVAYDMPCDSKKLAASPTLPPAYSSEEELFDVKSRDELLEALDMSLQPAWSPLPIKLRTGADLARYNRVEGLSLGLLATQELGAGYTVSALGRFGHADLHANGELSLARSNSRRTVTGTVYHRLNAVNPEWAGALTFGPSLPALLYARDEGFYYRTLGAELREVRELRGASLDYRIFVERQWTAGDSDVVNTFNLLGVFDKNRNFQRNIDAQPASITGIEGTYLRAFGSNPLGLRLLTSTRAELGTGTFEFGRLSLETTLSRPISRFVVSLAGSAGSSAGTLPRQRLWNLGGLRTVRGQVPGTQAGNAFWLGRAEVGTKFAFVRPVAFFDVGWAGDRTTIGATRPMRGVGLGLGFLDGLFRVDVAKGIFPGKGWRTDFYLGAPM
ncbi:MAG: hypothetical protein V4617_12405 [Gemmatimonadota bacterium]